MLIRILAITALPLVISSTQLSEQVLANNVKLSSLYNVTNAVSHLTDDNLPSYKFKNIKEMKTYVRKTAKHYKLSYKLMLQILSVESNYCRYRVNSHTSDFGCFQIHRGTIQAHKWNFNAVVHNDMANTIAAAIILSDFKKAFSRSEPATFACRYNIGYRTLPETCRAYLVKLSAAQ